jgi:predicted DNA binding CopG/RHH family protein
MKEKTKKADKALEAHWEKVASLYENPKTSMKMLERSRSLTSAERRKFLGKAKTKAVSIRIPEDDLVALKEIAQQNDRKYQQLIILAIEQYIDHFIHK